MGFGCLLEERIVLFCPPASIMRAMHEQQRKLLGGGWGFEFQ
jgi:hypothetical protein